MYARTRLLTRSRASDVLLAARPHQCAKNVLLFVPLIAGHRFGQHDFLLCLVAALAFSCCAAAVYLLNDLRDVAADRQHLRKRRRPIAAGTVSRQAALLSTAVLLATAFAIAHSIGVGFSAVLLFYLSLTTLYTLYLKQFPVLDLSLLSLFYLLRIFAGAVALDIKLSGWLIAFSLCFFFSLAALKRYVEMLRYADSDANCESSPGAAAARGYRPGSESLLFRLGILGSVLAFFVFTAYIFSLHATGLYARPNYLWPLCIVTAIWMHRVWSLARANKMHDDPVVFALADAPSFLLGAIGVLFFVLAM